jgi:hypothetical protein
MNGQPVDTLDKARTDARRQNSGIERHEWRHGRLPGLLLAEG